MDTKIYPDGETAETAIDSLDYRGYHILFWNDDAGQQIYTIWEGEELGFGCYNFCYKDDMQGIIDNKLDTFYRFTEPAYFGAKIMFFENDGYRDLKLYYRSRELKIYTVLNELAINKEALINDAKSVLNNYVKITL